MTNKTYLIMLGAPKCGTTSLSAWIGKQPYAVLAKQKETMYFTDFSERTWSGPGADFVKSRPMTFEAFEAEYSENPDADVRIEASTDNLSCPAAVENIARFVDRKEVRAFGLIVILRDPIERIVSEYEHTLRLGWQTGSLLQSLQLEKERVAKGYHPLFRHAERSRYFAHIERYREVFGDRLMIVDFAKIQETAERNSILEWIGRSDEGAAELEHSNKRSVVARPAAVKFLKNDRLLNVGRALFPKNVRPVIRKLVTGGEVGRYKICDSEIDFIQNALGEDIQACIDAQHIPTENWALSQPRITLS